MPRAELCFSMMTTTRSLDLAAETVKDAAVWKDALHMLLVELCPNKQWAMENLRRNKPFWNNTLENPPPVHSPVGGRKSTSTKGTGAVATSAVSKEARGGGSIEAASPKPLRKEAIKKQVFNACRAGDVDMLESMFKAGVPANLMDEKNKSDTPLMVACQIGNAALVRLCLQYGAKNDPHPDFGETALHVACRFKHQGAASVILEAAAQSDADHMICNLTNEETQTPLHVAAGAGHRGLVDLLLGHGAVSTVETSLSRQCCI